MKRLFRLATISFSIACLTVFGLSIAGFAGEVKPLTFGSMPRQDPAPPPVVAPVPTVGDLISGLATAKQSQSDAQAARDAAAKALADADAALTAQSAAVASADAAIKSALAIVGPIIVKGVVYEPTADGYRSFTPATADTPVPGPAPAK